MLSRSLTLLAWCVSVICFATALYVAVEHTAHIFANHNYFFSPFADDILDNSRTTYPIALGKQRWMSIFSPYIDHRVAIEHVQELIDFTYTHGVQVLQPYRISILLWLNWLIFAQYVIRNMSTTTAVKLFLASAYLMSLFSGMNINNYVSTMQITWPIVFLFALLTFVNLSRYCEISQQSKSAIKPYIYILLTTLCLNVVLYTFNIGIILWPIIFFILICQRSFFKHSVVWIVLALVNYYIYLEYNWVSSNFIFYTSKGNSSGLAQSISNYLDHYSRIITVPFNADAFYYPIWLTKLVGLLSIFLSLTILTYFLKLKKWRSYETIYFGYFLFSSLAMVIISIMRAVDWRFITTGLMFDFCLLMFLFMFSIASVRLRQLTQAVLILLGAGWLLFIFLPADKQLSNGTYELSFFNQVFISEATNIPVDDNFLKASKIYQTSGDLGPHVYINDINKSLHKGVYSFWASAYLNQPIAILQRNKQILHAPACIYIAYDYRPEKSAGLLLNVQLNSLSTQMNNDWQVIFTDQSGTVIGFAISAPILQPLWAAVMRPTHQILWRGAVGTQSLKKNEYVYAWAVDRTAAVIYKLGRLKVPGPLYSQDQPTWVWESTKHFGIRQCLNF